MPPSDFFHILNPNQNHRASVAAFFRTIARGDYGWVERTSHPTHLETLVEWAIREGRTKIAVWGGDGSLNRTVESLRQFDVLDKTSLALIPVGTCNDFARKFNLNDWTITAKFLLNQGARPVSVDVGFLEIENKISCFINNSGFGRSFEAALTGRRSAVLDIFNFTKKNLDIEWEDSSGTHQKKISCFFSIVFNSPYFGGGKHFSKDIDPCDGVLNGVFVPVQNRVGLLVKFIVSKIDNVLRDRSKIEIRGRWISVTSDTDLFPQVDGEMIHRDPVRYIRYSIYPKKLQFLIPENTRR